MTRAMRFLLASVILMAPVAARVQECHDQSAGISPGAGFPAAQVEPPF